VDLLVGQPSRAASDYRRAIDALEPVVRYGPSVATARRELCRAYRSRGEALTQLNQHGRAVADLDRAIELNDGPDRAGLVLCRAVARVRIGAVKQATDEADTLANAAGAGADTCYEAARVYCVASAVSAPDPTLSGAYADQAMTLLRRALAGGLTDAPRRMRHPDLAPLRRRDDYAGFVWDLADLPIDKAKP
jgi:tetratricopeptide (TPR) repeat protein